MINGSRFIHPSVLFASLDPEAYLLQVLSQVGDVRITLVGKFSRGRPVLQEIQKFFDSLNL